MPQPELALEPGDQLAVLGQALLLRQRLKVFGRLAGLGLDRIEVRLEDLAVTVGLFGHLCPLLGMARRANDPDPAARRGSLAG